jgi:hypothetical protein
MRDTTMRITNSAQDYGHGSRRSASIGPRAGFLACIAVAGAIVAAGLIPNHLLMPAISTLLFALAMAFALVAWIRCSTDEYGVTYWDVSGALILIGICTSALIEPETLAALVAGASIQH